MFKQSNLKPERILQSASKHCISLVCFQLCLKKKPQREPNHFSRCILIPDVLQRTSPASLPPTYTPNFPEQVNLQQRELKTLASRCLPHLWSVGEHCHLPETGRQEETGCLRQQGNAEPCRGLRARVPFASFAVATRAFSNHGAGRQRARWWGLNNVLL